MTLWRFVFVGLRISKSVVIFTTQENSNKQFLCEGNKQIKEENGNFREQWGGRGAWNNTQGEPKDVKVKEQGKFTHFFKPIVIPCEIMLGSLGHSWVICSKCFQFTY